MAHETKNYINISFGDSPDLVEEFSGMKPGDEITVKVKGRVANNEDNSLVVDIIEVILPEGVGKPVTQTSSGNEGNSVVSQVLTEEKAPRSESRA